MRRTRDILTCLISTLTRTSKPARPSPGQARADLDTTYAPKPDGRPDPGEIVWTWVPYEDDPRRGKDRPVLLIGRRGSSLVGLMMTSKDHDRDAADEARWGRYWLDIGAGGWDARRRPSEVRLDRLLEVDESGVRREGSVLDQERYEAVVAAVRAHAGPP
jgi:hypothetical protein